MPRSSNIALAAIFAAMTAVPALAQAPATIWPEPPRQQPPATMWPDPPAPQTAPTPQRSAPAQRRAPAQAARPARPAPAAGDPAAAPAQPRPPRQAATPRAQPSAERTQAVNCAGPFARNATHIQLAQAFGAQNVVFTEVAGPEGTKLNASVVYPNDPKRRLEVLWHDEATRARPSAIVITGASRWAAPSGLRIGTSLTEVEKRNGKAFKLSGFGSDGGSVVDWDAGKLDKLGACRMGMRFTADGSAAEALSKVTGQAQLASNSPDVRAVKPKIVEIIVGYSE